MKQSVYKYITFRLKLLKINIVNSWQSETAYFGDAWGNVLSTIVFTLVYIVFISVIFANVKTLAGYTKNDILFFFFINQISYYLIGLWSMNNVSRLVTDVNRGNFDLMLVKPLPALFYSSTRNISLLTLVRDGLPAIFFTIIVINWSNLTLSFVSILAGIVIMIAGQLAFNGLLFLLGLPVFWFGQAADLLGLSYSFNSIDIPYDGVTNSLRMFLTLAIPILVPASLAASVMLGKTNPYIGMGLAIVAAIIFTAAKSFVWKRALLNYSSASS